MANIVILIGNLGNDPEMRNTQAGTSVTNFRMATHEQYSKNGRREEETDWHRIVCFGRLAEIVNQYAKKGHSMFIRGKIKNRKWEDNQGVVRYTSEIVAREIKFLTPKGNTPTGEIVGDDEPNGYIPGPGVGGDVPF